MGCTRWEPQRLRGADFFSLLALLRLLVLEARGRRESLLWLLALARLLAEASDWLLLPEGFVVRGAIDCSWNECACGRTAMCAAACLNLGVALWLAVGWVCGYL